jgi:hypothetical protein
MHSWDSDMATAMQSLKEIQDQIRTLQDASALPILSKARVIGCTTTAAAKYTSMLQDPKVAPAVVMVEEAGELLEVHALTSLSPRTKQLIMVRRLCAPSFHGTLNTVHSL